jgi:hypothetical protein
VETRQPQEFDITLNDSFLIDSNSVNIVFVNRGGGINSAKIHDVVTFDRANEILTVNKINNVKNGLVQPVRMFNFNTQEKTDLKNLINEYFGSTEIRSVFDLFISTIEESFIDNAPRSLDAFIKANVDRLYKMIAKIEIPEESKELAANVINIISGNFNTAGVTAAVMKAIPADISAQFGKPIANVVHSVIQQLLP